MPIGFALLSENECRPLGSLQELEELWPRTDVRFWVDLESPTDDDLRQLGRFAALDEESLEDCLNGEQQPPARRRRARAETSSFLPATLIDH